MLIRYEQNEPEDYFISLGKVVKLLLALIYHFL